jgi:DNA/RNA endonuclease YhcR with UshA esterase domain
MEDNTPAHRCPSCGQFVGPYDRCPYCGAATGRRLAVRLLKYGSLGLALLGLAVLLLVARHSQVPVVKIDSLSGTMNWAYVRIEGVVSRQPEYDPLVGSLQFWVWDGSGEIMVSAYRSEAGALLAANRVPAMGDAVAVEGTLRVKEDFQYLVLNIPEHTEVRRPDPTAMAIAQIDSAPLYARVTVEGVVRADRTPYEGLRLLTLRDASGEIDVTLPSGAAALGSPWPALAVGQSLQVTGAVDRYQDTPQLAVGRGSDLLVLDEPLAIAPSQRIGELSTADVGRLIAVEGTILRVSTFSAGVKCLLDDGSGTATLLLWQDLYDALPGREALVRGATVRSVGQVAEYGGELEIVPELPADLALLAAAEPAVIRRQVGQVTAEDVGRTVALEGELTSLETFSAGVRGRLDDGTGTITLLLWQEMYNALEEPAALAIGARLSVLGEVDEYRGELEIVPQAASDLSVAAPAVVALISPTPILSPAAGPAVTPTTVLSAAATPSPAVEPSPTVEPPAVDQPPETAPPPTTEGPTASPPPSPTARPTTQPTPAVERRAIGAITAADVDSTLAIERAGIAGVSYMSAGVRYTLTDASGSIVLILWQDVLEEMPNRYDLFPGSQVRVTGQIDEYNGNLEIIPRRPEDVTVLNRGERGPIEERAVADITPSDEGRALIVAGRVTRTDGRQWLRLWLDDGTGEILIYVPERAMAYLPPGLGPGLRLRVTGEVDVYQGQVEIIPLAGADVGVQ